MSTYQTIELTGRRTRLRELVAGDLDAIHAIVGDDRVTTFLSFDSRTRDEARGMLDGVMERRTRIPRTEFYLAVTSPDEGSLLGFVRLALTGVRAAKLGYAIGYDHQGMGYATDATATMLDFGFTGLGLHRVTAAIGPGNPASVAVVKRHGFVREGVLRDHVFTNGAWRDSQLYSLLADEKPPTP